MKTQAIIPTAGTGTRLKAKTDKPLILLQGIPLFIYSLKIMEKSLLIDSVIVVAHPERLKDFNRLIKKFRLKKVKQVVAGGETRCDSVRMGLNALDSDTGIVLIHDGARPFVTTQMIEECVTALQKEKAVTVAVPVKPTIKRVDPKNLYVQETLPRETLWEIQTPQAFRKEAILEAHQKMLCCNPSDDAVLVEKIGVRVKIVKGDYRNIKITTNDDVDLAKLFLKN